VKLLAQNQGLSIRRLADKAGVAERTLWNILGEKTLPHFSTIVFLAEVLKVSPSDLLLSNKRLRAQLAAQRRRKHKAKGLRH
jgi:transcriptional regulator with XRE-family HTH domain